MPIAPSLRERAFALAAVVLVAATGVISAATPAVAMHPALPASRSTPIPGATTAVSEKGLFQVRYESSPTPVPLLTVHTWTITVTDAAGQPVREAAITVLGGMPAHAHGLPTTPVVSELGDGRYRVEGLKFHMPGAWVVAFRIRADGGTDAVSFALELP